MTERHKAWSQDWITVGAQNLRPVGIGEPGSDQQVAPIPRRQLKSSGECLAAAVSVFENREVHAVALPLAVGRPQERQLGAGEQIDEPPRVIGEAPCDLVAH